MRLALREAAKGQGRTSPNPCVGAVVVKEGTVVAKGYHRQAGSPHAEVNALNAAGEQARGATLYVTLEPCNHQGRTPPCTERILAAGIKRVVVGMSDPNPQVVGGGNAYLANRGLDVVAGILATESLALNRPFVKHITSGFPWVIMKAGMSLDGRIACRTGQSQWITGELARGRAHLWRDRVDAILIGAETALADDPTLTARPNGRSGRDPLRVILDSTLRLPPTARMLRQKSAAATWVFAGPDAPATRRAALIAAGAVVKEVALSPQGGLDLQLVLAELGRHGVTSLLVEGGGKVHAALLRDKLYDQACLFAAPLFLGADGLPVVGGLGLDRVEQGYRFRITTVRRLREDLLIEGLFGD
ncbi:MAG: bifunctional diaminohydroxyphosphoribosylaminopyrimidine deaminase/5-amino-6-(5-phosphoribosylamino)uracil reductase RibD [Desulfobulbaceae bacterium]|nr:bifunctional diaminohydroxyphosphoribosylaminopyrimidine deaminase/5-amino-6-(5-phosphoribosylamino)uracil reductase RibD [Desulfobulbaceae bacterium]